MIATILIVEDEALVALEMEDVLVRAGYRIVGLADTLDTTRHIINVDRPDLALCDMRLAEGETGIDVALDLGRRGIPCLFVTGNCTEAVGSGLALGCLHKPFNDRGLVAAVHVADAIIAGRRLGPVPSNMHLYDHLPGRI
ncbi:MAG: response regulator [Janthinobacterium lividum]